WRTGRAQTQDPTFWSGAPDPGATTERVQTAPGSLIAPAEPDARSAHRPTPTIIPRCACGRRWVAKADQNRFSSARQEHWLSCPALPTPRSDPAWHRYLRCPCARRPHSWPVLSDSRRPPGPTEPPEDGFQWSQAVPRGAPPPLRFDLPRDRLEPDGLPGCPASGLRVVSCVRPSSSVAPTPVFPGPLGLAPQPPEATRVRSGCQARPDVDPNEYWTPANLGHPLLVRALRAPIRS